jgi:hypothetical protein
MLVHRSAVSRTCAVESLDTTPGYSSSVQSGFELRNVLHGPCTLIAAPYDEAAPRQHQLVSCSIGQLIAKEIDGLAMHLVFL